MSYAHTTYSPLSFQPHEVDLSETNARYAAYSAAFARGFRCSTMQYALHVVQCSCTKPYALHAVPCSTEREICVQLSLPCSHCNPLLLLLGQWSAGANALKLKPLTLARRYLAFTSDFGEALRPVVASRIVTVSQAGGG